MDPDARSVSPAEAFSLLGDGTRVAVLRALWETDETPLGFADIRARVGNPDSGRLNYHLGELVGHLLAKDADGYRLTQAGREVVRAILAGTVTRRPTLDSARIDGRCAACGGTLLARYDGRFVVECGECDETVMWNEFPPAGLDGRTPADAARAFDRWTRHRFRLAMAGICPSCAAGMKATVSAASADTAGSEHRCPNCRYRARIPLFAHALYHPAAISLLSEDGIDVTTTPYWDLTRLADELVEVAVSEEPWTAEMTVTTSDRSITLAIDDTLDVHHTSAGSQ